MDWDCSNFDWIFDFTSSTQSAKSRFKRSKEKIKVPFSELLKDKQLWILLLSALFINAANYGLTSWLASYLSEVRGISISEVSYISSLAGLCILIAVLLVAILLVVSSKEKSQWSFSRFAYLGIYGLRRVFI